MTAEPYQVVARRVNGITVTLDGERTGPLRVTVSAGEKAWRGSRDTIEEGLALAERIITDQTFGPPAPPDDPDNPAGLFGRPS